MEGDFGWEERGKRRHGAPSDTPPQPSVHGENWANTWISDSIYQTVFYHAK